MHRSSRVVERLNEIASVSCDAKVSRILLLEIDQQGTIKKKDGKKIGKVNVIDASIISNSMFCQCQ